ncbi:hypothetical protein J7E93_09565 [Streptomyces sp. ISL-36]|uniref:mannosyltransferase family protein n=1 Tax=Streptomyces sp. ISL-36 TaxID=2819182 RepID=UPI001BED0E86|nr:mannosyltransferase family protein [Streptomyces sp. ISL-36]MBT2440351.1 hypothetical protein [Streptomyces sp. ISL-36]
MPVPPTEIREPTRAAPRHGTPPAEYFPAPAARRLTPSRRTEERVRRALRLRRDDGEVLCLYLATRAGLWITAYCTRWLFPADGEARQAPGVLAPFERWDWGHYLAIARDGYFPADTAPGPMGGDNREAFFPGFPLVLRAVHVVVPHWTAAGLLISLVAGAVAVVALARIARHHLPETDTGTGTGTDGGRRAVLFLLVSPCGIFLAAGYTEALFLALALPAWLAAQRHAWALATTLTTLATTVRVSGLFLAAAVALHLVLAARADRRSWRRLPWAALPALPPALYTWYLHTRTGDWMAWKHAQERGWYRDFHTPWAAWSQTWDAAFTGSQTTPYAFMFQAELAAMLVGLLLLGLLIRWRRLPEALYVALTLWALGTSYWYTSIPRATLLWWPLWIALAHGARRSPRFTTVYLCLTVPLTMVYAVAFLSGRWAG